MGKNHGGHQQALKETRYTFSHKLTQFPEGLR